MLERCSKIHPAFVCFAIALESFTLSPFGNGRSVIVTEMDEGTFHACIDLDGGCHKSQFLSFM